MKTFRLLRTLSLPYLRARPVKILLTLLGMALGVAAFTAIDLCQRTILESVGDTISRISGNAHVSVVGGSRRIHNEDFSRLLLLPGTHAATPLVRLSAKCGSGTSFVILGIDPLSRAEFFAPVLKLQDQTNAAWSFVDLMRDGDRFMIDTETARTCGMVADQPADLIVRGKTFSLRPVFLENAGDLSFVDIATAQEKFGGDEESAQSLTQIDVLLDDPGSLAVWVERFQADFPELALTTPGESASKGRKLLEAFRVNLTALGLVSMFVSVFLVYNAASLALLKRRREIGILRSLGLARKNVILFFLTENLIFGFCAAVLGIFLGEFLANGISQSVFQTASNLYAQSLVSSPSLTGRTVIFSLGLGLLGVALGTALPLWEVLSITPTEAARRLSYEKRIRGRSTWIAGVSAFFWVMTAVLMKAATIDRPFLSFAAALTLLLGFLFATPLFTKFLLVPLEAIARRLRSGLFLVATSQVKENPYRAGVVIAALSLAVGLWLGVGLMVSSFRASVSDWIEASIQGDVYLILPEEKGLGIERPTLPPSFLKNLSELPDVRRLETNRTETVRYENQDVLLSAVALDALMARGTFRLLEGDRTHFADVTRLPPGTIRAALAESFAHRRHLRLGDDFSVKTPWGEWRLNVGAILYDYSSERGLIYVNASDFRRLTGDDRVHAAALFFENAAATGKALNRISAFKNLPPSLEIQRGAELRAKILKIFDQTFLVTEILKGIALTVAFLGVLTTIASLAEERRWEYGLLMAQGLSQRRLGFLGVFHGFVLSLLGESLGALIGLALSHVIIAEVHYNFFGWTIFFDPDWHLLPKSAFLTVVVGSLAGLFTLRRLRKITPAQALRYDE